MSRAYIDLLQKRIDTLEDKDFDLEVWKNSSALLLARIFGEGNSYTKEAQELKVDFSSWSLRDATSDYNPKQTAKRLGREILEMAISELKISGHEKNTKPDLEKILEAHSKELAEAVESNDKKTVLQLLKKTKKDDLAKLLLELFTI